MRDTFLVTCVGLLMFFSCTGPVHNPALQAAVLDAEPVDTGSCDTEGVLPVGEHMSVCSPDELEVEGVCVSATLHEGFEQDLAVQSEILRMQADRAELVDARLDEILKVVEAR